MDCPCGSSTKIRVAHDPCPTKPPCGRHGGVYKGRWSTTTPVRQSGGRGGGSGRESRRPGLARATELARSAAPRGAVHPAGRGQRKGIRGDGREDGSPSGGKRREERENPWSRGACGEALTGVRSERGRRDAIASRWPREAETPEGEECVPRRAASPGGCVAVQMASAQAKHWQWGYRQRRQALRRESAASSIIKLMLRVA